MVPVLEIKHLSVSTRRKAQPILRDVSFRVEQGERVGLIGESGSGKTTLARSALHTLDDDLAIMGGNLVFLGQEIDDLRKNDFRGRGIYLIMQSGMRAFEETITLGRQFEVILRDNGQIHDESKLKRQARILEAFQRVRLHDPEKLYHQYSFQCSGGMLQRLMIAAALLLKPKLIIADEPTTALDTITQTHVLDEILDALHETKAALLLISHDLGVIRKMAERVLVLKDGQLVEDTPANQFFEQPHSVYGRQLIQTKRNLCLSFHNKISF